MKDHCEICEMIDHIVLDDIINDFNMWLIGEMSENGEHTENELAFLASTRGSDGRWSIYS